MTLNPLLLRSKGHWWAIIMSFLDLSHYHYICTHSNIPSPPWIIPLLPTTPPAQPSQGPPFPTSRATAQVPTTLKMTTSTCRSTMIQLKPTSPLDSLHSHSFRQLITLDQGAMEVTSFQACLLLSCLQLSTQEYL